MAKLQYYLLFLVSLVTMEATAQPRLDHVAVDEFQHKVVLSGDFSGLSDIRVYCDSVLLPLSTTNNTEITATISDSGRGSCGPVWITSDEGTSNRRFLTFWHYRHFYRLRHPYSDGGADFVTHYANIHLRFDWQFHKDRKEDFMAQPTKRSDYVLFADGYDGRLHKYTGPKYSKGGMADSQWVTNECSAFYDRMTQKGIGVDDNGEIIPYDVSTGSCEDQATIGICEYGRSIAPTEFLPATLSVDLSYPSPTLVRVMNEYIDLVPDEARVFTIVNITGTVVQSGVLDGGESNRISTMELTPGLYLLLFGREKVKFVRR